MQLRALLQIMTKRNQLGVLALGRVGPKWLPAPSCRCVASLCTVLHMAHKALTERIAAGADDGAGRSAATI